MLDHARNSVSFGVRTPSGTTHDRSLPLAQCVFFGQSVICSFLTVKTHKSVYVDENINYVSGV